MLFGPASAQSHYNSSVLLGFRALGIEEMPDIVDTDDILEVNVSGFRIDLNLNEMCLAAHNIQIGIRLPVHCQIRDRPDYRMGDCRIDITACCADSLSCNMACLICSEPCI